jgi:hypothetical protein
MVNMVLDELFLRIADGFLHGVQLLREVQAGPTGLDHFNHSGEVTLRAFQPRRDLGKLVHR